MLCTLCYFESDFCLTFVHGDQLRLDLRKLSDCSASKHFVENYFLDDLDLLITRRKWFLSSDNSGMIVVQRKRLFNHLFISITSIQRLFMTTRKQWNQLSANFKDAQSRLKNVNIRPSTKILNLALGNLLSVGSFNLLFWKQKRLKAANNKKFP